MALALRGLRRRYTARATTAQFYRRRATLYVLAIRPIALAWLKLLFLRVSCVYAFFPFPVSLLAYKYIYILWTSTKNGLNSWRISRSRQSINAVHGTRVDDDNILAVKIGRGGGPQRNRAIQKQQQTRLNFI